MDSAAEFNGRPDRFCGLGGQGEDDASAGMNEKTRRKAGSFQVLRVTQAAKFLATKSQFTRFQNASTYFGRRLR